MSKRKDSLKKLVQRISSMEECPKCRHFLIIELPYCLSCGEKNFSFSLEDSEEGFETLEIAQAKNCPSWHKIGHAMDSQWQSMEEAEEFPFCGWCGKEIVKFNLQ